MSEIAVCDMCGKRVPFKRWGDRDVYYPFKMGRRVFWLGIMVYQGKPNKRRRRLPCGRSHLDLCRACTLKAVLSATKMLRDMRMAYLLNPLPRKKKRAIGRK